MTKLEVLHAKWMKNPKYKKAYNDLEEEYELMNALIDARISAGLTQAQLAKKMQTTQSAVARMESGKALPSTRTLTRLAAATGSKLRIKFERTERREQTR
jgi:transcriptional regulator with XRE-family HTH domain